MEEGRIGEISEGWDSIDIHLEALYPIFQAKLALANLIEVIGTVDMMIAQPSYRAARPGWKERLIELAAKAAAEASEIVEFGSAFDTDEPIGPRDEADQ